MWLVTIAISTVLLSTFIILIKKPFFKLTEDTLSLLNVLLDSDEDDAVKQKKIIRNLLKELKSLGIFILAALGTILIAFIPIMLYMNIYGQNFNQLDFSSVPFFVVLIVSSIVPFYLYAKFFDNKKSDYSEWSVLLHTIVLDNYNLSKSLFSFETSLFRKKIRNPNQKYLIISGLARSGTTALTTQLFETGKFHSLNYSNMPFLLSPNLWKTIYKPKQTKLKERSHGDKVMFGFDTVEALEEHFFKVFLKDSYIGISSLVEHEIDDNIYSKYLNYQNLVKPDNNVNTIYLSKNNNLILRYQSLRKFNSSFLAVFLFRDPLNHAYSLLKQHKRFSRFQQEDPFIKRYMSWLGHHEFGEDHKYFEFSFSEIDKENDRNSINYWLKIWINYYSRLLQLYDNSFHLVEYQDYLKYPKELLEFIGKYFDNGFDPGHIESFKNSNNYKGNYDSVLGNKADNIYNELVKKKIVFYNVPVIK